MIMIKMMMMITMMIHDKDNSNNNNNDDDDDDATILDKICKNLKSCLCLLQSWFSG